MDGTIDERAVRRWFAATARELTGIIAAIMNAHVKSLRAGDVNAVVLRLDYGGTASGAFGLASLGKWTPVVTPASGLLLRKAWKGKVRSPDSLTGAERELINACAGMAVAFEEQIQSGRRVSAGELAVVLSDALRPLAHRLTAYPTDEGYKTLRFGNQLALNEHAARLARQIARAEEWCDD